ncbi:hypothetical protein PFISCL1PPCAC_2398, partial [Pristionchus fissidentatus]
LSLLILLFPYALSLQSDVSLEESIEDEGEVNLIVDVNMNRFVEGLSDLTDAFNNKFSGDVSVDHSIDGGGVRVFQEDNPLMFTHFTLSSATLVIHNNHLHLEISDFSGLFHGTPEIRSVLHQRFVPWSRSVRVHSLIGPIHIIETSGFPYVNQHLHCKVDEIEVTEEESMEGETEMDRIVGRIVSDKMKLLARTEHLACTTLIQAFDSIIRQHIQLLQLSMVLPSDSLLIYSLINNPTWLNTSSSSSNLRLLRCHFHSQIRPHRQRDLLLLPLPPPQMDPLLRMGSLRPLGAHHHQMDQVPLDLLPSESSLHHQTESLPPDSQMDSLLDSRSALQPFDVYYHIFDSSFTKSIDHLCKKGLFDKVFAVPRGDFNISLQLKCEGIPRVDLSDLHDSWKMKVGLPLLYIYRNDSSTQSNLIEKILTLSIHVTQLRLSFIVQSAFPQPNELGRFVFSNQIFRHLSSTISTYYTLPLPFIGSVRSSLPFVSAVDNRLVLALNLTRER